MKRILIPLISLAVIAAGSVAAFLVVKHNKDKEEQALIEAAAENNIFSFDADTITTVSFSCEDGEYTAEKTDDGWLLTGSDTFDLDQDYFLNICEYASALTAETNFGDVTDENRAMYGLDDPDVVTLSDGTNEYTIYVGAQSPTSDYYYVTIEGKPKVFALEALNASVLITSRMMMKDKSYIPYDDSEVYGVTLIKGGETVYDLTYDDTENIWSLPEEYSALTLDQTEVTSMIAVMTRLEAQTMLDENLEDYSKYGFDKPVAEVIITGSDGSQRKHLFSYYGNDANTYTHVLYEETGQVATFYTGDVDFIEDTPKSFITKYAFTPNKANLTGFKIEYGEINCDFTTDYTNSVFSCNGVSINEAGSEALSAYTDFFTAISNMEIVDTDVEAKPNADNPTLSLTYRYSDDTEKLIQLVPDDNGQYYFFLDGEYNGIIIGEDDLTGKYSISYFYKELTELVELN